MFELTRLNSVVLCSYRADRLTSFCWWPVERLMSKKCLHHGFLGVVVRVISCVKKDN